MSRENVEIVRAMIDAANRRDWDAVFRDTAPNFKWDHSRAVGPDSRGVWTADEARDYYMASAKLWEDFRIEIDELIASGDFVVVPHTMRLRGRDGVEVSVSTTWPFTIRGDNIQRVCLYQERRDALEAAGLSE